MAIATATGQATTASSRSGRSGSGSGQSSPVGERSAFELADDRKGPTRCSRRLCTRRVAVPMLLGTLVTLAVLVARNNSLAAAESPGPSDDWARVTPAGSRPSQTAVPRMRAVVAQPVVADAQPASIVAAPPASPPLRVPKCVSVRTCIKNEDHSLPRFACWGLDRYAELPDLYRDGMSEYERCLWRSDSLSTAKRACEQAQVWCAGVVRDNGIYCSVRGHSRKMVYELRRRTSANGGRPVPHPERSTWRPQLNASTASCASAAESAQAEEPAAAPQPADDNTFSSAWWANSAASASLPTVAGPPPPPSPPPPPPPPPLPPLPPELQLGEAPAYGTKGGQPRAWGGPPVQDEGQLRRGTKPNVVLMNVDDTGYGDYGFNNPLTDDTPHLDALRARGMRFSDLHAGASVCTPSRASLMTGRLGLRTGVTGNFMPYSLGGLPRTELTVAALLKQAGYVTGMAGKWHLGHRPLFMPRSHGFDSFFGLAMSHDYGCTDHPGPDTNCVVWERNTCDAPETDGPECPISPRNPWGSSVPLYVDDTIVEQPVDHRTLHTRYADYIEGFLRTVTQAGGAPGAAASARVPFFLYVAFSHLHTPIVYNFSNFPPGRSSPRGHYGNAVRELDETVGRVVGLLETLKLTEQTLVLFTGDNGGGDPQCEFGGNNAPFVGVWQREHGGGGSTGKTSTWEGGHREPGLAVWPGHIAAGATSRALVSQLDFLPTLAALAGVPLPAARTYDGLDLSPVLFGAPGAERALQTRILLHPNSGEGPMGGLDTVRVGRYKAKYRTGGIATECPTAREGPRKAPLLYHEPPLLFDLASDPAERNNLNPSHPYYAAVLRVLSAARDAAAASAQADELISQARCRCLCPDPSLAASSLTLALGLTTSPETASLPRPPG